MEDAYNLSQLRILWEIASDGLIYNNFIAHSETASGDFGIMNLKTDIVEQKWRTADTAAHFFILDAGATTDPINAPSKAIYVDTLALIGCNFYNGYIEVSAYGDAASEAVRPGFTGADPTAYDDFLTNREMVMQIPISKEPSEENVIWIADSQPRNRYRHWMIEIQSESSDGYFNVGRFLAGQASILSQLENYTSDVKYSELNYKDEMEISGFSSIANNRALKKKLSLTFDKLNMTQDNYKIIRRMMRYIRDTKKALVIPDPLDPYLFNLFAKLEKLPEQNIRHIDKQTVYSTFSLDFNEAR